MHIDLKGDSPALVDETLRLVQKYSRENITVRKSPLSLVTPLQVLGAISQKKTDKIKKQSPKSLTFCSLGKYVSIMTLYVFGLLPFFPISFDFFSVGKQTVEVAQMAKNPPPQIKKPTLIK